MAPRGRPKFIPTNAQRAFVLVQVAAGTPPAQIAAQLGIAERAFKKHFANEILNGKQTLRGRAFGALAKRVEEGHLPSIKLMLELLPTPEPEEVVETKPTVYKVTLNMGDKQVNTGDPDPEENPALKAMLEGRKPFDADLHRLYTQGKVH